MCKKWIEQDSLFKNMMKVYNKVTRTEKVVQYAINKSRLNKIVSSSQIGKMNTRFKIKMLKIRLVKQ